MIKHTAISTPSTHYLNYVASMTKKNYRKYQPIWEQIKEYKSASVAAEPCMHSRLIKAVIKEKYQDIGWKVLAQEQGIKYKLEIEVEGKLVVFKLVDISPISIYSI